MKAEELRRSVLQLAVEGKLVEQRPEEGTARELLAEIAAERERLVREGKMKKGKPLAPVSPDEVPFEIPESWEWVRLGDIGDTNIGLTYNPSDLSRDGTPVLRSNNIQNGKINLNDLVHVSCPVPDKAIVEHGDILVCARNGSKKLVGKCALVDCDGMAFGAFMAVYRSKINQYVYHYINSDAFRIQVLDTKTTTINQITQNMLKSVLIPLPPLAEQRRIVARLEELMPLIDAYDAEERRLSALETEFPEQLRRSLLQYAVEGKLVEQRPGEGTAGELLAEIAAERERLIRAGRMKRSKPLAPVSQDEVPFEIPESWEWINIEQICSHITDGEHIKPQTTNLSNGIPLLMAKNVRESHLDFTDIEYISTENAEKSWKRCYPEKHDILICSRGASVGRSLVINSDKKFCLMGTVILLKPLKNKINSEFLNLYLKTEYAQYTMKTMCGATAQGALYLNGIKKIILPLPPLAEQRRIVARLEELMPLIDRIHTPVNVTAEKEK